MEKEDEMEIKTLLKPDRIDELVDALVGVWEASVRPTHGFLAEADIVALRPRVREGLIGVETLVVAFDDEGRATGFLGVEGDMIEVLFVAPEVFGRGLGRQLLDHAVCELGARRLDVNEENPGARGFYEHMGFVVVGRSALDGQGRPFPLLHMELQ